jgi:crotonobetainyl-CoA:carnitine CoA-transferase CaiB-like acyl-CoA transferase
MKERSPRNQNRNADKDKQSHSGALQGIRVLDLGLLVQGPQAALLLADLGADVIKVELPQIGDQSRWLPASLEDLRPPWFIGCNRGKRSITLDLHAGQGQEVFLKLAETADIVISNFLPGTMESWGLGYDDLAARNPGIIFGAASAFGPLGPDASRKGADISGQASGGMMYATGTGPQDITPIGVTLADHIGSQNLVSGILAALYRREKTGQGQKVEVSLLGGQIYAQASEYTCYFLTGKVPGHAGHGHPMLKLIYSVFPTLDGHIAVAGVAGDRVPAFFEAMGRPELAGDIRFTTPWMTDENKKTLIEMLTEIFKTKTTSEWESILEAAGQRYSPVRDYAQVAADEGAFINGYLQRVDHPEWGPITMIGCPIRLSHTPAEPGEYAPELGQHTEEILLELGYDWDEINTLRQSNIL